MVDITTKAGDPATGKSEDPTRRGVVRVQAKNDDIRRVLKHGITKVGFPASGGSVEWPNDTFTKRRIADGDVTIEQLVEPQAEPRQVASEQLVEQQAEPQQVASRKSKATES